MKITELNFLPFSKINLNDHFFDSLRKSYVEFNNWFNDKAKEGRKAYVIYGENKSLIAFLALKLEDQNKTLKVCTFKVANGVNRRLGERFIRIILKSANQLKVNKIYLTTFANEQTNRLVKLLNEWGFEKHGKNERGEDILERVISFNKSNTPKQNFPLIDKDANLFWLPIENKYHNKLIGFDASSIKLDKSYDDRASIFTIEKYYITNVPEYKIRWLKPNDILILYRMGEEGTKKSYSSIVTSVCVFEKYETLNNLTLTEFMNKVKNKTAYDEDELLGIYKTTSEKATYLISFLFNKPIKQSENRYFTLKDLWDKKILSFPNGPRPLDKIEASNFDKLK